MKCCVLVRVNHKTRPCKMRSAACVRTGGRARWVCTMHLPRFQKVKS